MANTNIRIDGVKQTVAALKAFAPEIQKTMNVTIRAALNDVRTGAQARYPKGSWQININTKKILGSIAARSGGGRVAKRWEDSSPGVKAAIFEFAGKNQPGKTPQAQGLIKSLNARYGAPGRFLWDSWDTNGKDTLDTIANAVRKAERELQAKLDAAGEAY